MTRVLGVPALWATVAVATAGTAGASGWPGPNADLSSTRSAPDSSITARNVDRLVERWRYRIRGVGTDFGHLTATPVVVGDTVYLQTWKSDVVALDRATGRVRWSRETTAPNDGPNGVSVSGGRVYAATDTTAFALDVRTGRTLWTRRLADSDEQFVDIAPVATRGRVYLSTVGFPPGGRGALYALDARTGRRVWKFETVAKLWPHPQAGGGGAWYPLSIDARGRVYAGTSNPGPWGGSRALPNGGWFRGATRYLDSLVVLDGATGKLLWTDQVTRHDVRDYDFQVSPVLAEVGGRQLVFGAGKAGRVVAWDRGTRKRVWTRAVGTHLNDLGPLPVAPTTVCPGLFGGVLTPMAYSRSTLYVPVVELCMKERAVTSESVLQRPASEGKGVVYALEAASGRVKWTRSVGSPLFGCATATTDVVVVPAFDGTVRALSGATGRVLWSARARAGINSCPAIAGDMVLVGAGAPRSDGRRAVPELIAYGLPNPRK